MSSLKVNASLANAIVGFDSANAESRKAINSTLYGPYEELPEEVLVRFNHKFANWCLFVRTLCEQNPNGFELTIEDGKINVKATTKPLYSGFVVKTDKKASKSTKSTTSSPKASKKPSTKKGGKKQNTKSQKSASQTPVKDAKAGLVESLIRDIPKMSVAERMEFLKMLA